MLGLLRCFMFPCLVMATLTGSKVPTASIHGQATCATAGAETVQADDACLLHLRATESNLSSKLTTPKPNILHIVFEAWRADWAGFDEAVVDMPTLAQIVPISTRFEHAYVPAPTCIPARSAIAVGRSYENSPVKQGFHQDFPVSYPTLTKQLQAAGYYTIVSGKDHLSQKSGVGLNGSTHAKGLGYDAWEGRMGDLYETFTFETPSDPYGAFLDLANLYTEQRLRYGFVPFGSHGRGLWSSFCTNDIKRYVDIPEPYDCPETNPIDEYFAAEEWMVNVTERLLAEKLQDPIAKDKPLFLQMNFHSGHAPFIITEAMDDSMKNRVLPSAIQPGDENAASVINRSRRHYTAQLERTDSVLGKLLENVKSLDPAAFENNTLIILTGDHGDMIGDYGRYGKELPQEASVRTPLLVAGLGAAQGHVVRKPVSTLGIVATILEAAGADAMDGMESVSLWPALHGGDPQEEVVVSQLDAWRIAVKEFNSSAILKLICCPEGCPATLALPKSNSAQVALINVTGAGDGADVLAWGRTEAQELLSTMPERFVESCSL